jgi:hypothetical protein
MTKLRWRRVAALLSVCIALSLGEWHILAWYLDRRELTASALAFGLFSLAAIAAGMMACMVLLLISSKLRHIILGDARPLTIQRKAGRRTSRAALRREQPPQFAEYLLYVFLRKEDRETAIGDLYEGYAGVLNKFGARKATWWAYCEVLKSLWPLLVRIAQKLATWGLLGLIGQIIRHLFS